MPSDSGDRKAAARAQAAAMFGGANPPPPPPQSENLPCPRCDSTNTKFCYYNNYNLSQPRHFCKSCRRYWTQGGTLRNVPIGGGTRKNSKRSRAANGSASASMSSSTSSSSASSAANNVSVNANAAAAAVKSSDVVENVCQESFTSLLSSQGHGFLALSGSGYGFDEMGFGSWPATCAEVTNGVGANGDFGYGGGDAGGVAASAGCNGWQMNGGGVVDGGLIDGDGFAWPDLAISTTSANGFK